MYALCVSGFNVYIIVDLIKHSALTLVGEIGRYRNECCYYLQQRIFNPDSARK